MDYAGNNTIQLPQFSELTSRSNASKFVSDDAEQTTVYTTAVIQSQSKPNLLVSSASKYSSPILTWPDPTALMQFCEKQGLQTANIPNYNQNNAILNVQTNNLPMRMIPNICLPSTSQSETTKQVEIRAEDGKHIPTMQDAQAQLQSQSAMTEYMQKLQASTLPLSLQATTVPVALQQLIKIQSEQIKKNKTEEEKMELIQNNILNIPSISLIRNIQLQNGNNSFMNSDQMMLPINPHDLNIHIEQDSQQQENENTVPLMNEQIQTDEAKTKKKKFRAKLGEIKITIGMDGTTMYCCPECNVVSADEAELLQHVQAHIQERKYECKECGAMLKRKEHLDQHMRGHSDERPYKCTVCHKAFKRNEHKTRHFEVHFGEKKYPCPVCHKAFSRKDHLKKHSQTHLGNKKSRMKKTKGETHVEQKESFEKTPEASSMPKEMSFVLKDGEFVKQEPNQFLQYIQNLQKDQNLIYTFSSFREQAMKETNALQHQAVNMSEILPQNTRYLTPS